MTDRFHVGATPGIGGFKPEKPVFVFGKVIIRLFFPDIKKQEKAKSNRQRQSQDVDKTECPVPDQVAPGYFYKIPKHYNVLGLKS